MLYLQYQNRSSRSPTQIPPKGRGMTTVCVVGANPHLSHSHDRPLCLLGGSGSGFRQCVGITVFSRLRTFPGAEYKDQAAVNSAVADNDTVARDMLLVHIEVSAAMFDKHIPLFEAVVIQQQIDTFSGG